MTSFEKEYQRLNTAQRQAVDFIEGPVLVVAGPGTGKTQLLSMRVANILRKTDVQPYNILCLTYTESGKQAMVARLSDFLSKAGKRIEVHTFHSFGTRLITRFPDYFPELTHFRPAEDLTLYETLHACLQRLPRNNPLSKHAYGQFTYQVDARDRISQLKRAGISPESAQTASTRDLNWCRLTGPKIAKIFQTAGRLSPKVVDSLIQDVETVVTEIPDSDLGRICLDELKDSLVSAQQDGKATAVSNFKKKWFVSEDGKFYFKPTDQMKKLVALAELYSHYEDELKSRQLYDYDDMILYSLEKLKQNEGFRAQVQETFQYILADEYQDTNAAQASIINLIADNPVNEGRPNVMVVGDDDQAIYGFQGALGDVLMDFRERWRDVKAITLKDNYRSTPSILSAARAVITQGQNRLENHYEDIDKTLLPKVDYIDTAPTIFETVSPEAVVDKAVRVAKGVDSERQLAIIATKHKYLLELAERLDAAKVSYYYEGREDLLKDDDMTRLLLLADLVLAVKQKDFIRTNYVLPELIANGVVGLPRSVAWKIAVEAKDQKRSWWEVLVASNQAEAKLAAKTIKSLVAEISTQDTLDSLRTIAKCYHLRILQKIKRLIEHAKTYFGRDDIGLSELLRYSELCQQAGVTLEHTIVRGNRQSPIVLLSAHKSKGLEFDRVYVLHADYNTWFKEGGRRNNLVLPANWQSIEPLASNTDDRLRLLYVVMTRAKQELALIKGQGETFPGLDDMKIEQHVSEQLETFNLSTEPSWRAWYIPKTAAESSNLKSLLQPALQTYHLSPTHLTMFLDVTHSGPTNFFTSILLGIPEPVHAEAIFGSHVHKALSFAQNILNKTGKAPSRKDIDVFVRDEMKVADEARIDDIVQVVTGFINHGSILRLGGTGEYSFSSQNIELDGKRLTGTVDHFTIDDNILMITDYKTGRPLSSWRVSEDYYKQKLHRFRQQLLFYELLFSLSPKFSAASTTSKVAFVEPSRRDIYYQLVLDADTSERDRLVQLIEAVWRHVINLSFPDSSVYSLDMAGIDSFEDDLLATTKKTPSVMASSQS